MVWELAEKKWKWIDITRGRTITCNSQRAQYRLLKRIVLNHTANDERPWSGIVLRYSIKIMEITWRECSEIQNPSHFKLCYLKKCASTLSQLSEKRAWPSIGASFSFYIRTSAWPSKHWRMKKVPWVFFLGTRPLHQSPDCTLPNRHFAPLLQSRNGKLIGSILILLRPKCYVYPCIRYCIKSICVLARVEYQMWNQDDMKDIPLAYTAYIEKIIWIKSPSFFRPSVEQPPNPNSIENPIIFFFLWFIRAIGISNSIKFRRSFFFYIERQRFV